MRRFRMRFARVLQAVRHGARHTAVLACALCITTLPHATQGARAETDDFAKPRARMVATIRSYARQTEFALGRDHLDRKVLDVMATVPRHEFISKRVSDGLSQLYSKLTGGRPQDIAYADQPLPIGYGQTISQPFIVALMTDLAAPKADHVVLEVGTGSGYQAAVLAPLVRRVCTIEIIPELGMTAADTFKRLKLANIESRIGDGYYGWQECGPFDSIVVTAAADHVPPPLLQQLKPGGRLVIPVGAAFATQQLVLARKTADGRVTTRQLLPVRFVPLVSKE